jgi:CheY-like chemotaxis protein
MTVSNPSTAISTLIADDSSTVCMFIEKALNATGRNLEITVAHNGHDAVQALSKQQFDLAFLDINMPQLNGIEVMAAIHVTGANTFAVSMSDKLTEEWEEKLKSFGAYDFLSKPFSNHQVHQIVRTYEAIHGSYDILVVDDSATVRRIVEKVLKKSIFDLHIDHAEDGPSAIEAVKKKRYRIIFTDFNMPGMTGIELAERLEAYREEADVIVMSTEMSDTLDQAAQRVGARAFLRKPFYPADVDSIIHHLFNLRHSRFSKQVRMFAMT